MTQMSLICYGARIKEPKINKTLRLLLMLDRTSPKPTQMAELLSQAEWVLRD